MKTIVEDTAGLRRAARQLTPELEEQILAAIRAGGFPHVAALAFGVPRRLFRKWLRRGPEDNPAGSFGQKVAQAHAIARLDAEMQTHKKDPRLWLRSGPGRETKDAAGWTTFVRPQARDVEAINLFSVPAFLQMLAIMRDILGPYPEAYQALTKALELKNESSAQPL